MRLMCPVIKAILKDLVTILIKIFHSQINDSRCYLNERPALPSPVSETRGVRRMRTGLCECNVNIGNAARSLNHRPISIIR